MESNAQEINILTGCTFENIAHAENNYALISMETKSDIYERITQGGHQDLLQAI